MPKRKHTRGGRRPGAGRPRKLAADRTVLVAARVPVGLLETVDGLRREAGLARTTVLVQSLREWCRLRGA
jgi:hypothetical protein